MKKKHMHINLVIDTNVLVSVLITSNDESPTVKVFKKIYDERFSIIYNKYIIKEYIDVLYRDKLKINNSLLDDIILHIVKNGKEIIPKKSCIDMIDESDRIFYDTYKSVESACLITGNTKHYIVDDFILTPREFIDMLSIKNDY